MMFFPKKVKNPIRDRIGLDIFKIFQVIANNWCKRAMARDRYGEQLFDPFSKEAEEWCILGAAYKIDACQETFSYLGSLAKHYGYTDISRMNDMVSHKDLVNLFAQLSKQFGYKFQYEYIDPIEEEVNA